MIFFCIDKNSLELFSVLFLILFEQISNQLNPSECGNSFAEPNLRIKGGQNAVPHSWPSVALLLFEYKYTISSNNVVTMKKITSQCGATLIEDDKLLTAAHCFIISVTLSDGSKLEIKPNNFHKDFNSMYKIYLGLHDKSALNSASAHNIASFKLHPDFEPITCLNDIAVIKLEKKVVFSQKIQPACIPLELRVNLVPGAAVWALGWGSQSLDNSESSNILRNVRLKFIDKENCGAVTIDEFCIGDLIDGNDTMKGDSGGPVFMKSDNNKQVIVGITSRGIIRNKKTVGIYARVDSYLNWIYDVRNLPIAEVNLVSKASNFFPHLSNLLSLFGFVLFHL